MTRLTTPLRLYGAASTLPPLGWDWVQDQLTSAGTYWVVAASAGHPHPRPVWGVWFAERLRLSLGSPTLRAAVSNDPRVTVHLDSGTDVVIVEGRVVDADDDQADAVLAYNSKYDWEYDVDSYGAFLVVRPLTVMAWRSAGPAGRDGFQEGGRWQFEQDADPAESP